MDRGRIGTVERDGVRTVYEVHGDADGPALLFGHAQILSRAQYAPQVEAFMDRYRVIALDFRGHGESPAGPASYRMEDLALDAIAVLDAEGVERAHYLGSSLGGMVGFALALEHASRLASVTFLATQGVLPAANGERIRKTVERLAAEGDSMAPAAEEIMARYTTEVWRADNPASHARLIEIASANRWRAMRIRAARSWPWTMTVGSARSGCRCWLWPASTMCRRRPSGWRSTAMKSGARKWR